MLHTSFTLKPIEIQTGERREETAGGFVAPESVRPAIPRALQAAEKLGSASLHEPSGLPISRDLDLLRHLRVTMSLQPCADEDRYARAYQDQGSANNLDDGERLVWLVRGGECGEDKGQGSAGKAKAGQNDGHRLASGNVADMRASGAALQADHGCEDKEKRQKCGDNRHANQHVVSALDAGARLADQAANHIVLKRSTDGGRTWGPLQVVARDGTNSLNNPCVVQELSTGRILLMM